ncbi:MAG TPA: DUF3017 domain-containing protein [Streptosporangiaceae bacterium]|nr:DUF3017 domain-containing protein [Streptosporangiaceae bacterium]
MANRPANAGAHSAGPQQARQQARQAAPQAPQAPPASQASQGPQGPPAPQPGSAAAPPPVHHQGFPRGRRAAPAKPVSLIVVWLPYLLVLAGTAAGLFVASQGSRSAGRGAAVVGAALLVAALARLALPPRYAGLLATRSKAQDVAGFAVLGAAVLAVAASLP